MNRMLVAAVRSLALAAALAVVTGPAWAEDETGGAPGSWLSEYVGARTLGLGGAFVGAADDASSVVWNPAGLSMLVPNELRFDIARLFEDTSVSAFEFAVPGNKLPSFGLSVLTLRSGNFERTNELNDPLGTFQESQTAYIFTMARALTPRVSLGVNTKLVRQSIEDFSGGGVGFDVGGIFNLTPTLRVGASALNLGGPSITLRSSQETYPTQFRGGFSAGVLRGRGLITAELDHTQNARLTIHGGSEYWVQPAFALRVGMNDQHASGGFSYRTGGHYQFDYGVSDHVLGIVHRIGISYRFGGFYASAKAEPEIFSPTGESAVTKILLGSRTKSEADSWSLSLINKTDEVVRRFGGKGSPPAHLLWDGKDESGMPLPDGIYRYQLVVHDSVGREIVSPTHTVEISTGGPQGAVPVIPVQP
ncbi:MAG: PorV/PorQ family protein [Candidatus Eisenbacteria bacterium]|uniref:PorV/PorQ family protein n=1 Tax=Eiseniibacteriota bacterium TaxID=2212470 RepID=A0A538T1N5_UNCEI|nr:MAG: PorV/PorQ family protein [Candidatus Eisenbacteria bacterium]